MTAGPAARAAAGAMGFVTLADELRVIKASPAWSEVRRAMTELKEAREQRRVDPSLEEDASHVRIFAGILREESALIANAIQCGAALGAVRETGTAPERVIHALRTVSRAYRFENLDDDGVAQVFRDVRSSLAERFPRLAEWAETTGPTLVNDDLTAWRTQLAARLASIGTSMKDEKFDRDGYRTAAWQAWYERIKGASDITRVQTPTLDELLCGAAGMLPTEILRFDLGRVSLPEWATVLAASISGGRPTDRSWCPPWMVLVALHVLGFRLPSEELKPWLRSVSAMGSALHSADTAWHLFGSAGSNVRVLLLVKETGSIASEWTASPRMAVLPLTAIGYEKLTAWLGTDDVARTLGITHVMAEVPVSTVQDPALTAVIKLLVDGMLLSDHIAARPVLLYSTPPREPPPTPYLVAPSRIEEALPLLQRWTAE